MNFKKQNKQALQKSLLLVSIICFKKTKKITFFQWINLLKLEKQLKKELNIK